ncbi:MAG TPA: hypothetical protein VLA56_16040 [Pseudomonadales bacterium]|nr:hypothetical protein [Pseudomonadales bacterium]
MLRASMLLMLAGLLPAPGFAAAAPDATTTTRAEPAESGDARAAEAEPAQPPAPSAPTARTEPRSPDVFVPTEEVSEDLSVSFPVDI